MPDDPWWAWCVPNPLMELVAYFSVVAVLGVLGFVITIGFAFVEKLVEWAWGIRVSHREYWHTKFWLLTTVPSCVSLGLYLVVLKYDLIPTYIRCCWTPTIHSYEGHTAEPVFIGVTMALTVVLQVAFVAQSWVKAKRAGTLRIPWA